MAISSIFIGQPISSSIVIPSPSLRFLTPHYMNLQILGFQSGSQSLVINCFSSLMGCFSKPINGRCMIRRRNIKSGGWFCMSSAQPAKESTAFSYKKFINFALEETKGHTILTPSPLQENFNSSMGIDGLSKLQMLSFEAPKVRLLRCLSIEGNDGMQVLDFAAFPRPEFDVPIFCANFFTAASTNIVVLDLNPLYGVITHNDYKEKYYRNLMPLGLKYAERFHAAFTLGRKAYLRIIEDYYKAWLKLMNQAAEEIDASQIGLNRDAQHRYLTWRAEKDPGHRVLRRLVGEASAEEILRSFLFNGVHELGNKTFLDYFPEYKSEDGTINVKRSMIGKSFENRPWDAEGNFLDETF